MGWRWVLGAASDGSQTACWQAALFCEVFAWHAMTRVCRGTCLLAPTLSIRPGWVRVLRLLLQERLHYDGMQSMDEFGVSAEKMLRRSEGSHLFTVVRQLSILIQFLTAVVVLSQRTFAIEYHVSFSSAMRGQCKQRQQQHQKLDLAHIATAPEPAAQQATVVFQRRLQIDVWHQVLLSAYVLGSPCVVRSLTPPGSVGPGSGRTHSDRHYMVSNEFYAFKGITTAILLLYSS